MGATFNYNYAMPYNAGLWQTPQSAYAGAPVVTDTVAPELVHQEGILTHVARDVIKDADINSPFSKSGDGKLSKKELKEYKKKLEGRLQLLNSQPEANTEMRQETEMKLEAVEFLKDNFKTIATRGGKKHSIFSKPTISKTDLKKIADNDGNPDYISNQDIEMASPEIQAVSSELGDFSEKSWRIIELLEDAGVLKRKGFNQFIPRGDAEDQKVRLMDHIQKLRSHEDSLFGDVFKERADALTAIFQNFDAVAALSASGKGDSSTKLSAGDIEELARFAGKESKVSDGDFRALNDQNSSQLS
ncbi:MAG: hypothetical protein KTR14_04915 [Vampirovibrio sp.]|nr:hypothetical protein [Vampirovibrio sp.]